MTEDYLYSNLFASVLRVSDDVYDSKIVKVGDKYQETSTKKYDGEELE